jgi:hypothetical protein
VTKHSFTRRAFLAAVAGALPPTNLLASSLHPYLYHVPTDRRVPLGRFLLTPVYKDEWRCDLHPCASRDGKSVVIDSPHAGDGRQLYLIDIQSLLA